MDGTTSWVQPTKVIIGVSVAAVITWDAIDGFLKARRSDAALAASAVRGVVAHGRRDQAANVCSGAVASTSPVSTDSGDA